MQDQFTIRTTAHWKAMSHPLRVGILRLLTEQALTNEELASALGVESGKLYFHTKQLLDAGLIDMVETRAKGPITEKLYQAVARDFVATGLPDSSEVDAPPFEATVSEALAQYRRSWREDPNLGGGRHYSYQYLHRVPAERMNEFVARMKELVQEFQDARTEDADALRYSFTLLLHSLPETPPPGRK